MEQRHDPKVHLGAWHTKRLIAGGIVLFKCVAGRFLPPAAVVLLFADV